MRELYLLVFIFEFSASQRVAPGVPPQQYQHPPPPPQQQHGGVPIQHQYGQPSQHIPMQQQQFQQVPTQQVPIQQHVPVQHVPIQQHHVPGQQVPPGQHIPQNIHGAPHGAPHERGQMLNPGNMAHEREHIAEHLSVPIDTSKMSEQELQFHYFKMHDADNNNKLDGCELIKSLIHWHDGEKQATPQVQNDKDLQEVIDPILEDLDKNRDGFIDYSEFKSADVYKV